MSIELDRRKFLEYGGLGLLAAALSGCNLFKPFRSYTSGETINSFIAPIEIDGWSILIDREAVESYAKRFPNRNYSFELMESSDGLPTHLFPKLAYPDDPASLDSLVGSAVTEIKKNDRRYWRMHAVPSPQYGSKFSLAVSENEEFRNIRSESYPIQVDFFSHSSTNSSGQAVYSETSLGDELLGQVSEFGKSFDALMLHMPHICIFDTKLGFIRTRYNPEYQRIDLSSDMFIKPEFDRDWELSLNHEELHAVLSNYEWDAQFKPRLDGLKEKHSEWIKAAGFYPIPPRKSMELLDRLFGHPLINIFIESEYIGKKLKIPDGHPYDNIAELFASAFTVFRYFPDQFIDKYRGLSTEKQKIITGLCNSLFSAIESIAGSAGNLGAIDKIVPSYSKVKEGIYKP